MFPSSEIFEALRKRCQDLLYFNGITKDIQELSFDLTVDFCLKRLKLFNSKKGELLPYFSSYIRRRILSIRDKQQREQRFVCLDESLLTALFADSSDFAFVELKNVLLATYRELSRSERLFFSLYLKELIRGGNTRSLSQRFGISLSVVYRYLKRVLKKARKKGLALS